MIKERIVTITQSLIIIIFMSIGTVLIKLALSDVAPFTFAWMSVGVGMIGFYIYTFVIRKSAFLGDRTEISGSTLQSSACSTSS